MYVNQTVMLYALNLYSEVCQLFLNKTGKKWKTNKSKNISLWRRTVKVLLWVRVTAEDQRAGRSYRGDRPSTGPQKRLETSRKKKKKAERPRKDHRFYTYWKKCFPYSKNMLTIENLENTFSLHILKLLCIYHEHFSILLNFLWHWF